MTAGLGRFAPRSGKQNGKGQSVMTGDVLWRNRCPLTRAEYKKLAALFWTAGRKSAAAVVVFLFAALAVAVLPTGWPGSVEVGLAAALFAAATAACALFLPGYLAGIAYRRTGAACGRVEQQTMFWEDGAENGYLPHWEQIAFDYRQIRRCCETGQLLVLILTDGVAVALRKDGFDKGTADEWKAWLAQKRPGLRWVWLA